MSNQIDSVSTDGIDTQYSSSKINKFKEKKEKKRNNLNNSKNSGCLKSVKSAKKKLSKSKQKQMEKSNNTNNKKVKFNKKIMIIEVESWKKYNIELTSDEKIEDLNKGDNEKDNKDGKKEKNKKEHISCACLIF